MGPLGCWLMTGQVEGMGKGISYTSVSIFFDGTLCTPTRAGAQRWIKTGIESSLGSSDAAYKPAGTSRRTGPVVSVPCVQRNRCPLRPSPMASTIPSREVLVLVPVTLYSRTVSAPVYVGATSSTTSARIPIPSVATTRYRPGSTCKASLPERSVSTGLRPGPVHSK